MNAGTRWQAGAFAQYLRTGRVTAFQPAVEVKFNPYHDPQDGRFTFGPGGGALPARHYLGGSSRNVATGAGRSNTGISTPRSAISPIRTPRLQDTVFRSNETTPAMQPANFRPNPRARPGGNSRAFNDPLTLDRVFPGLQTMPGGSIIALADSFLDVTGPAQRLTSELSLQYSQVLIHQITKINPAYRFESLDFPETPEGQTRQINVLKMDRATAFYKIRNELRPLQTETLRFLQARTDSAYAEGVRLFESGHLRSRLNRNEAIGNYVDRQVREQLRILYRS